MNRFLLGFPLSVFLLVASGSADPNLCLALFSQRQLFWPTLTLSPQRVGSPLPLSHALTMGEGKGGMAEEGGRGEGARLAVLPVYLESYAESKPCDSCHRLSRDGMEFFLGNALRRIFTEAVGAEVELIDPDRDLLRSRRIGFPAALDSLDLPWENWLAGCEEPLLFRPRESRASPADKRRLDRAAGALGFSHVFVVRAFRVAVDPKSRNNHQGSLRWSWHGALYHAPEGRFEWALKFADQRSAVDLDEDLEPALAKLLGNALRKLPADLGALLKREPR